MFRSTVEPFLGWLRERFLRPSFAALALVIAGVAMLSGADGSLASFAYRVVLAFGLLLQFRLWDDLADVELDRTRFPERVLCRVRAPRPLFGLVGLLALGNGALLFALSPAASAGFAALGLAYLAWYGGLREKVTHPALAAHALLLKYAGFVLLLSSGGEWPARISGASAVYLALCCHELVDDERLRREERLRALFLLDFAGTGLALTTFMLTRLR